MNTVKCEHNRVMNVHDRTVKPVEGRSHKVQEVGSLEHRDDVIKFNLAIDDENIDFNISGVPNAMVKRSHSINVHNLIQQIENHPQRQALQSDLRQHRAFNPFSKESQDAIKAAGNAELCEIVDVEPKAQCRACLTYWDVGIVYCTCGHFLKDDTTENKKYISSVLDLFSIPNFYIRKGRPHGHRYGMKAGDQEYHTANQLQKKCRKRHFLSIHDRFIRDTWFRKTMLELGRTEEVIREMDKLANEDHTHIATEEELNVYRSNWWIRSIFVGSDTMPIRHRPDFKKRCQSCIASRKQRIKFITKIGGKALPHLGVNGKIPGGIPHLRHHHDDGLDTDGAGYYSCVSAMGGGPGRAPLRPATAAELGARRHCRPRRSCRLPEREPLLRHQPGSAHSSSAKPFSTKAQYHLMAHAALAAHQASRQQSFMMMETLATVCTSTRAFQVMVWYPRTTTSSAQRTCHSTPNETLRCAKNVSANLRRCSGAMTGTSLGLHLVNINACPRVKDRTRFSTT